jgi:hypothetical protein
MKKISLFILIAFSSYDLFSQIDKGNYIISAEGHYAKTSTQDGVSLNWSKTEGQYLNTGASFGYFFSKGFVTGIGLDYIWKKEETVNELLIHNYAQFEQMDIKSRVLLPNLYVGYYFRLINKLYLNTSLKFSYGKIKTENNTQIITNAAFTNDTLYFNNPNPDPAYTLNDLYSSKENYENDLFDAIFYPEITYFISKNFGASLSLGGIEYSVIDGNIPDNSHWTINFNHNYWKFGVKIKL